jgi:predicted ATPase/class 3 adenylate cyclase
MSQLTFGKKVKYYLKIAGFSQKILANTLSLDRTLLTHKLNATGRTILTHPEIKQIVKALAELEAITTQSEALELLEEANCPGFSQEEWKVQPLKDLEKPIPPATLIINSKPGLASDEKQTFNLDSFLPAETLTFLFTDIEGSSALWEKQPQAMQAALTRHDTLLRQAIEAHGGKVFKAVGDGFYAAFPTAEGALESALEAQKALKAEKWPQITGELRVRMALHSGSATERDKDYFGQALNRTARLLSAGHGGQILLSLACAELLRDHLPEEVSLRELGLYRLKDLIRPELIFQVVAPELPDQFLPLKTMESYQHNLPVQLTSFIGREKEIEQVKQLLFSTHLLTLTGAGGVGKTRLALQAGADLVESFKEGVWLVELAPLTDSALVAQALVHTLGLRQQPRRSALDTLVDYLKPREVLLILDNCEHLIEACAHLSGELLGKCPALRILATSRETFEIGGEVTYRVPSLSMPDAANLEANKEMLVEQLTHFEAVRLFIERAGAAQPGFKVSNQTAPAVAQICYHLDGIPLALELAAARVSYLSVEQILQNLNDRFRLLKGGSRTSLPRHQTLQALIDWSYSLLSSQEQSVLNRLAVFAGGFDLEAAGKICVSADIAETEVMDYVIELARKSLLQVEEVSYDQKTAVRYRMLETIRQYGLAKLKETGETYQVRLRHLNYLLALAQEAEEKLKGAEQVEWLEKLEEEHDNVQEALGWGIANELAETALAIASALRQFWDIRGYWLEGWQWLDNALKAADNISVSARARGLMEASWQGLGINEYKLAITYTQESLKLYESLGDRRGRAYALANFIILAIFQRNFDKGLELAEESLAILKEENDTWFYGYIYSLKGWLKQGQGELEEARRCYEKALAISQELGNKNDIGWCKFHLGRISQNEQKLESATKLFTESASLSREVGNIWYLSLALGLRAIIELDWGNYDEARNLTEESLELIKKTNSPESQADSLRRLGVVMLFEKNYNRAAELFKESIILDQNYDRDDNLGICLECFGYLAWQRGNPERAIRLIATGEALIKRFNISYLSDERLMQNHFIKAIKKQLEDGGFLQGSWEDEVLPVEEAIALALQEGPNDTLLRLGVRLA